MEALAATVKTLLDKGGPTIHDIPPQPPPPEETGSRSSQEVHVILRLAARPRR